MSTQSTHNMSNMPNKEQLFQELSKAMDSNPGFSILETIDYVLQRYAPYKISKPNSFEIYEKTIIRRNNSEIYDCLKRFNNRK